MATEQTDLLTAPIDDYLLALADGIYQAQRQLSQVSINLQPGQPAITYQLPKVDFEFKMTLELDKKSESQETATASLTQSGGVLRVRPANRQLSGSESSRAEAASIIKGSFVAVPAQGGKPSPVVSTAIKRLTNRKFQIDVNVSTTAGEVQSGVEVQFNIDKDTSQELNKANNLDFTFNAGTALKTGVARTNDKGKAVNVLTIADEEPVSASVVVLVDVLDQTKLVNFKVKA